MEYISSQRHDFLNHLQVIMGFLQLNKKDEAIDYIKRTSESLQEASLASKVPWLELAAVLTLREKEARDCGGCLKVKMSRNLEQISANPAEVVRIIDDIHHLICSEMQYCRNGEGKQLEVNVFEDKGDYGIQLTWEMPLGRTLDKFGLLEQPVMERARRLMSKVDIDEEGRTLNLTMYFPKGRKPHG
jgi:sensor histidine kinase regulating citrate/malate metabolism